MKDTNNQLASNESFNTIKSQLLASEEKYKKLFDNLADEVHLWKVIKHENGEINTWELDDVNPAALKSWNKTKEQVVGKTANEIFGYDATKQFMPIVKKIFKTGKSHKWTEYVEATNQYLSMSSIPFGDYFISTGEDITERMKAEKALKESEDSFKTIFQNAAVAHLLADENGNYIDANQEACDLLGYTYHELLSLSVVDIVKPQNKNPNQLYKKFKDKGYEAGEIDLIRKNGEIKTAEYFAKQIAPNTFLSTLIDITERKKVETKLKVSEQKFRNIAENLPGTVLRYKLYPDGSDELIYISKGIINLYEIPQKKVIQNISLIWDRIHKDDLEPFISSVKESAKTLSLWEFEHRIQLPDGRIKWVSTKGVPTKQDDGSIIWDTFGYDITDSKNHKEQLELLNNNLEKRVEERTKELLKMSEELELYRLAAEHSESGVWYWDLQKNELKWDDTMYSLFGVDEDSFSGAYEAWESSLHPEDKERTVAELNDAIEDKKPFDTVFRIIHSDTDKVLHIRGKGKVERNTDGKAIAVFGTNWDVTREMLISIEREEALRNLEETQSQLVLSEKMASLGVLTAGVAHEINNPLNYILGGYSVINKYLDENEKLSKNELREYLAWIKTGADRAAGIVKSLNLYSRSNEGNNEKCDVNIIIEDCIKVLQHKLKDRIQLTKDFYKDESFILGNNGKLHQVVLNILSNAIDSITNEGEIFVQTKSLKDEVEIIIKDNGCGIAEEHLDKITDPFFTTKAPGRGTGLGLSISKTIINEHKGKLIFYSKPNNGTTFSIQFPKTAQNEL